MSEAKISSKAKRLNVLLQRAHQARAPLNNYAKMCQQMFYSNVDGTFTMYDKVQLKKNQDTFGIPINSKLLYPIVEQILSFITASKPYPRLVSSSESSQEYVNAYTEAYQGTWYENKGSKKLVDTLRDMLVTGRGYLHVRKNHFFDETTFRVVIDYVKPQRVFVDPECRESDLNDAEYISLVSAARISRAEKEHDIKINKSQTKGVSDISDVEVSASELTSIIQDEYAGVPGQQDKEDSYVLIKEFYQKKDLNVYIDELGRISTKRPMPREIDNPEKIKLKEQIGILAEQLNNMQGELNSIPEPKGLSKGPEDMEEQQTEAVNNDEQRMQLETNVEGLKEQLKEMNKVAAQMPNKITVFDFTLEDGEVVVVAEVEKIKKKRILRTLMVGDTIIEEEWLDMARYPIVQFSFLWYDALNNYGVVHFIKDLVKGMDKYINLMMLEQAHNGTSKVLYDVDSIIDPSNIETRWAQPGAWIPYQGNSSMPNGGRPEVIGPSPHNQSMAYFVDKFMQLIEYVTGMHGVVQGNQSAAPDTFGATQSLQNMGTQRVKLYSRNLESALENLAYVVVAFLQKYAPKDKIIEYFDFDDEPKTVQLMSDQKDLTFKVRVDVSSSLPTTRQQAAQMLGTIAQTAGDPHVTSMLTQYFLETIDLPQGKKWAEQLNVMQRMQEQMQTLESELNDAQGQIRSLTNNMEQKEVSHKIEMEAQKAKGDIKAEKTKAVTQIQDGADEEENEEEVDVDVQSIIGEDEDYAG